MMMNRVNDRIGIGKLAAGLMLVCSVFFLSGCDHETEPFDGPSLVDRFGPFELIEPLEASRSEVDFSQGQNVFFTAKFNKNVPFVLRITGQESGAVRLYELFDDGPNQENSLWNGNITELPLFRVEKCDVELIIPEEDSLTFTIEIDITGTREYEGTLITGFEEPPGDNIFFGNFEFEFSPRTGRRDDGMAGEGDWYYFFEGTDANVPNFFVGLIAINGGITGPDNSYFPVPTTVPSELYFNCFMWHDLSPYGIAVIQFAFDTNGNGEFDDGIDQLFQLDGDFPLNWDGWRHIFHTMEDVGMNEEQVQKIVAIRALMISDLNSQPNPPLEVRFGLDYMTFTSGQELEL